MMTTTTRKKKLSSGRQAAWKSLPPVPDEEALVARYVPLARRLAASFVVRSGGLADPMEAFSGAMLGLLEAVRGHDPSRGAILKTHVRNVIVCRILDSTRQGGGPISRGAWRRGFRRPLSLDALEQPDLVTPPVMPDAGPELRDEVKAVLRRLPCGRLRRAFALYHLDGLTCAEVGRELGVCESMISLALAEAALILTGDRKALCRAHRGPGTKKQPINDEEDERRTG